MTETQKRMCREECQKIIDKYPSDITWRDVSNTELADLANKFQTITGNTNWNVRFVIQFLQIRIDKNVKNIQRQQASKDGSKE